MGSASRNMNLMECLILLSIVSIVLIWILQAHFFVASCVAFSCRWGIDFICKALMTSIWPGSMRNSILSWYMRWHLGLQMMADKLWSQQVRGWSEGEVLCVQQLGGRWICSPEPSRAFLLSPCWDFWAAIAAEAEGESISARRGWSVRGFGLSLFLISHLFLSVLPNTQLHLPVSPKVH